VCAVRSGLEFGAAQFRARQAAEGGAEGAEGEVVECGAAAADAGPRLSAASWGVGGEAAPVQFRMLVYLNEW
jgi:hypothetical protein